MDQQLAGVWTGPAGTRVEVEPHGDGWRVTVYSRPSGGSPEGADVFTNQQDLAERIGSLQAQGFVRRQPGAPTPQRQLNPAGLALVIVGALILVVLLGLVLA